ncbi:hypothetical protein BDQ12DRAFT_725247 [Crucibulum laeve]|uniref:DUF4246 domain-containing protein n=1 Tax=Crucibulum laeve TaxID=68775 RepID=A0A5C3LTT1_9AGAR|nr:hypothetical protein BDQ12DRAFT_725247 [Crucibulum laeve]
MPRDPKNYTEGGSPPYLPGFGLPINYTPYKNGNEELFPNALIVGDVLHEDRWHSSTAKRRRRNSLPLTTLREFTMLRLMNQLTDKPDWDKKEALKTAVAPLENVPEREKDWHPGSGERVLDLVHPSLFPLVYGRSRILKESVTSLDDCIERCGEGEVIPVPPRDRKAKAEKVDDDGFDANFKWLSNPYSRRFQWLPCEVDISGEEDSVKITSYINNLHPRHHKNLYGVIEKIIAHTIPLWNLTLTPLESPQMVIPRIPYKEVKYELDPEKGAELEEPNDYRLYWLWDEEFENIRRAVQPEPGVFCEPPLATLTSQYYVEGTDELDPQYSDDLRRDYGERGLQIIVKLANIHLTPEKPEYEGGTWHVGGQLNEHICSTALYYYDNENITASSLAFRRIFGCLSDGPAVQEIGSIDTREGRLITFPNIFQHQVQPFKLVDPTKPGHRKILALFLVDPHIQTISTAHVPCQQKEWWMEAARTNQALSRLPVEVQQLVVDAVDEFPISMQEAKQLREKLMAERKVFATDHSREFSSLNFSLCEH